MSRAVPPRRTGGLLRNLQVWQKLFASFGVLCLLVIAVGATGLYELDRAGRRLDRMYAANLQATGRLGDLRADVHEATALTANATQTAIAAAVEQQTATTNEMGRNVGAVASGSHQISANAIEVAEAAAETTGAASNTAAAADELARVAHGLRQSLAMFRY